jgi:hypothetical protein
VDKQDLLDGVDWNSADEVLSSIRTITVDRLPVKQWNKLESMKSEIVSAGRNGNVGLAAKAAANSAKRGGRRQSLVGKLDQSQSSHQTAVTVTGVGDSSHCDAKDAEEEEHCMRTLNMIHYALHSLTHEGWITAVNSDMINESLHT